MEQNMQFRSAGFGGFNRQDVLNYIEETTKEYNQRVEELRAQYEAAQAEADELRQALDVYKRQVLEVTKEALCVGTALLLGYNIVKCIEEGTVCTAF